jgi:hypothetical protein
MRQVLPPGRSIARAILAAATLLWLLPAGCGDDAGKPNLPPTVTFTEFPAPGTPVGSATRFAWTGSDPDGEIIGYEYSLDSEEEYTAVADSAILLAFSKEDGTESNPLPHVFRVRAVDNRSLVGTPAVGHFTVAFPNDRPSVNFTRRPPSIGYAGPVVTLGWIAEDEDGTIVGYEYQNVTGDTTSAGWIATTDTTITFDLSMSSPGAPRGFLSPLNRYQTYTFYLRAVDNENKRSNVIRAPYTSGPENLPPTVAFTQQPADSVTGAATWSWSGLDNDGGILRYLWAFDLTSDADWQSLGPDVTSFNRTFTRQDGSTQTPRSYTFHLRAQDSDSSYSAPITDTFTVAVPNAVPRVQFLSLPFPTTPVGYLLTIRWSGSDDGIIVAYEYALDGRADWITLPGTTTSKEIRYTCADSLALEANPNPVAPLAFAYGHHTFSLRALDDEGARSTEAQARFITQTRTPFTTILTPQGAGGEVTVGNSFTVTFTGLDVDGPLPNRLPVGADIKLIPVSDFADVPDAQAAVTSHTGEWLALPAGLFETGVTTLSGKFLLAIRSRDEAQAVEPYFHYGRNVLKVTVP